MVIDTLKSISERPAEQLIGGYLMAEGTLSMAFSPCKDTLSQIGRFIRIAAGFYIFGGYLK